jgi:hypothetical protein
MNKFRVFIFALAVCPVVLLAQFGQQRIESSGNRFRLNEWHPYVYLEADHVGPREPRSDGEPKEGIWLRLHNNCREPIVVLTFGVPPNSDPKEIGVLDNVLDNPAVNVGEQAVPYEHGPVVMAAPSLPNFPGVPKSQTEAPEAASPMPTQKDQSEKTPHGYMFPVSSSVTIMPGQSIYFSLPINHVSRTWHFEIPFRFALKRNGPFREPISYLPFFWDDLPETYRKAHDADPALPSQNP